MAVDFKSETPSVDVSRGGEGGAADCDVVGDVVRRDKWVTEVFGTCCDSCHFVRPVKIQVGGGCVNHVGEIRQNWFRGVVSGTA